MTPPINPNRGGLAGSYYPENFTVESDEIEEVRKPLPPGRTSDPRPNPFMRLYGKKEKGPGSVGRREDDEEDDEFGNLALLRAASQEFMRGKPPGALKRNGDGHPVGFMGPSFKEFAETRQNGEFFDIFNPKPASEAQ
jgi:hypothetical protein